MKSRKAGKTGSAKVLKGLDIPTVPRDFSEIFGGVDGRGRDAGDFERTRTRESEAGRTIAAEERVAAPSSTN